MTVVVPVSGGSHTVSVLAKEIGSGAFIRSRQPEHCLFPEWQRRYHPRSCAGNKVGQSKPVMGRGAAAL